MITLYRDSYVTREDVLSRCGALDGGCVMALGFFDGVHAAHRRLLKNAYLEAKRLSLPLAVFTFSADGEIKPSSPRLYSDKEKLALLSECKVDFTFVADFESFRNISKSEFVKDFLVGVFDVRMAVCGYNFTFGRDSLGNAEYLKEALMSYGADCIIEGEYALLGERISTSRIRDMISKGDMLSAAKLLGSPYFISGRVEHGRGEGKRLGIPTVNTSLPERAFFAPRGVYASALTIGKRRYHALTNIGACPTFGERESHAETFILDFEGDLYGKELKIYLLAYLRDERKFSSADELLKQIKLDTDKALSLNLEEIWQEIGQSLR